MRLTPVLWKHNFARQFKDSWKKRAVARTPSVVVPRILEDNGIEIVDPVEFYREQNRVSFPKWEPPVKDDPRFGVDVAPEEHPDYNEIPMYEFTQRTHLLEGEKQALLLTKSQPFYELPQKLKDLMGAVQIPNQDQVIQRYIMQANLWDPTKDKLAKRFNNQLPGWKFKAEWGIPDNKRTSNLMRNLVRLCQTLGYHHPDLLSSRRSVQDHYLSTYYNLGGKLIHVKGHSEWMLSSSRPLAQFESEELVDQSVSHQLPDMFPVAPTIDLKQRNIYKVENIRGWHPGYSHHHPHTLFINTKDYWTLSRRNAKALMFCFGHTAALAKEQYGWDVKTLPEPISIQCILTNGEQFNFVAFQLNTLNMDSSDGIKNFVWFDTENSMYNKILPKRAMLRNTRYEDYDPSVFQKVLAMYINGSQL